MDEIAESFKVWIRRYNHVIYLMPYEDNDVIGMKMEDLRNISGSKRTNVTAYMSMYLITLFLELFYNGVGESLKTRDYVSIEEVSSVASKRLQQASSKVDVLDEEEETGITSYLYMNIGMHYRKMMSSTGLSTANMGMCAVLLTFL